MIFALLLLLIPLLTKSKAIIAVSAVIFGVLLGLINMKEGIDYLGLVGIPRSIVFMFVYILFSYFIAFSENILGLIKINLHTIIHGFQTKSTVTKEQIKELVGHDVVFLNIFEESVLYRIDVASHEEAEKIAKYVSSNSYLQNFQVTESTMTPIVITRLLGSIITFLYTCVTSIFYILKTYFMQPYKRVIDSVFSVLSSLFVFIYKIIKAAWELLIYPLKAFNDKVDDFSRWGGTKFVDYLIVFITFRVQWVYFQIQEMINDFTSKIPLLKSLKLDIIKLDRSKNYIFR